MDVDYQTFSKQFFIHAIFHKPKGTLILNDSTPVTSVSLAHSLAGSPTNVTFQSSPTPFIYNTYNLTIPDTPSAGLVPSMSNSSNITLIWHTSCKETPIPCSPHCLHPETRVTPRIPSSVESNHPPTNWHLRLTENCKVKIA